MSRTSAWTAEHVPDLTGKTTIVTGANSGLGIEAARQLARKGAHVVLACRDLGRAHAAIEAIERAQPAAKLEALELDLASLTSVRQFAESFLDQHGDLHVLVNNAGVMALPYRKTADDFEMQMGTNHLGHFALTGLLLERLLATSGARVVTMSSNFHRMGRIRFDDLQSVRVYSKWGAYAQSKLANLLFSYELQRRLDAKGATLISVACHPGYAATNLQVAGPRMSGSTLLVALSRLGNQFVAQSAAAGALPALYAATAADVRGGDYIGPDGFAGMWGPPVKVTSSARSHDSEDAERLWRRSEELTGVRYEPLAS